MSDIYNYLKDIWYNPNIEYLFDVDINEYDIQDAGFSIIKEFHLLPEDEIHKLSLLPKGFERHKQIGILQINDKNLAKNLKTKFAEVRKFFINANQIDSRDIIGVKKDAIFTTKSCNRLKFGQIQFNLKNHYSSYIRFANVQNMEVYYNSNGIEIKGINEIGVSRHRIYMIQFLQKIIPMIEERDSRIKRTMMKFIDDYKSHKLSDGYYLEFNRKSDEIDLLFNYQNIIIPLMIIIKKEVI